MSGFDVSKMIPLYLDEADEFIAALNDMLLRLEQSPDDASALQEAFRCAHSMKGSSAIMGFEEVKNLTHEMETIFDQLRAKRRTLDLPVLQLFFGCLDALRDYHQELRVKGSSEIDLAALTARVVAHLRGEAEPVVAASAVMADPVDRPAAADPPAERVSAASERPIGLRVVFRDGLQLTDMKARLVLNRLAAKTRILESDPPAEKIEEGVDLRSITVWLAEGSRVDELRAVADVDGVARIEILEPEEVAGPDKSAEAPVESVTPSPEVLPVSPEGPTVPTQGAEDADAKKPRVAETIRVDLERLDSLMNLAGELVINKARFLQVTSGLEELFKSSSASFLAAETEDRLEGLDRSLAALSQSGPANGSSERLQSQLRSLRDDFRAIRGELDLIREGRERLGSLSEAINQLARVTDGIQKGVLNTRMVPVGPLFGRFRRIVRDLSIVSGKELTLQIRGEKTELDKRMVDELGDPLLHMVRNAIDHGLESPEERERLGKPRAGTVNLSAVHRGNSVLITVADDGRGIDVEKIRRKIVKLGLVSRDEAARLTDRELIAFIWHPGMTTAEQVTDLSGRGVGMDIVKSRIEGVNGLVDVKTTPGHGTTFSVRLPLTLAIMPSLLVRIYDEAYAVPLDHVDEIVEAPPAVVHRVQGGRTLEIRRKVIGMLELNEVFRWGGGPHPSIAHREARSTKRVVVIHNGEDKLGLEVDELIGIQEVVLKSLEKNFRSIRGLSGASILGDGRVSLILDVDAIISMSEQNAHRAPSYVGAAGA
jgi:two-component system chemotaxis sensor kinase CheA